MLIRSLDIAAKDSEGQPKTAGTPWPPADDTANRKNMVLLIQLRWIAVVGQIITISYVQAGLGISLPLAPMSAVLAALVALNIASLARVRRPASISDVVLLTTLMLDVVALTAQLYLSGGATNPFAFLYLLQVTLAAVLLDVRSTAAVVAAACISLAALTKFYRPLAIPGDEDLFKLHITGSLICFALDAALVVVLVMQITRNLRERDARLAALKQHAAEEDHIVRMGLLASGAAHELGTPLSSVSVILGDWRHMPPIATNPELSRDVAEMQAAVQRCKSVLSNILLAAGEARGEVPRVTTVNDFLDAIVRDWRVARSATTLFYENAFGADVAIVADSALQQVIFNVLDNAFEASPGWIGFMARRNGDMLELQVRDVGPGFKPEMLEQFGKPYQSSKGRLGGGLGLFLVVNAVRKFGGSVTASNRSGGGAVVSISLPLTTLAIGGRGHGG